MLHGRHHRHQLCEHQPGFVGLENRSSPSSSSSSSSSSCVRSLPFLRSRSPGVPGIVGVKAASHVPKVGEREGGVTSILWDHWGAAILSLRGDDGVVRLRC